MKTFDIYCDASVQKSLRGACAGALIVERGSPKTSMKAVIQPNGTNNSGEIGAILLGTSCALEIRNTTPDLCQFNIFSDSNIGIRGVREWMFHWIAMANQAGNYKLINNSGQPVANQMFFKCIFNFLVMHNLQIHFYHQAGHVNRYFAQAAKTFEDDNGIPLFRLGLSAETISSYNNFVDTRTRSLLRDYFGGEHKTPVEGVMIANIDIDELEYQTDNMAVPYIIANTPPTSYQFNNPYFDGKETIKLYAKCVYALDYPSGNKIKKYLADN